MIESSATIAKPVNYAKERFDEIYAATVREIPFNMAWKNNTGYLDHMIQGDASVVPVLEMPLAPEEGRVYVKVGEIVKGVDDYNRKFLYIASRMGGVVVFERYGPDKGPVVHVKNNDSALNMTGLIPPSGRLSEDNIADIFGFPGGLNLEERITRIAEKLLKGLPETTLWK